MTAHGEEFTRGRDLRGETWLWSREGEGGKRSPVVGVFCERIPEDQCRPCFSVQAVLDRFFMPWKVILGTPNPTPPKVVLEAMQGFPPQLPAELQQEASPPPPPQKLRKLVEMMEERSRRQAQPAEPAGPSENGQH
jgi:hypothetical protein